MNESPTALKARIDRQRDELGRDLDALGDRLSPRRIVDRRKDAVTGGFRSLRDRVMGTATDTTSPRSSAADTLGDAPAVVRGQVEGNPLAAGALAFAAGLVVAALFPETDAEQQVVAKLQPEMERMAEEAGRAAHESAERIGPAVHDAVEHVGEQARESVASVRDRVGP